MSLYTELEIAIFITEFHWKMINHLYIPITKSHWYSIIYIDLAKPESEASILGRSV